MRTISYLKSMDNVSLTGFLSTNNDVGSCVIEFRNHKAMISLKHSRIMELIQKNEENNLEKYIATEPFQEKVFLQIGEYAINLEEPIFKELVMMLKDFFASYKTSFSK